MPGTVSVALKLPHGLHLRLFKQEESVEPVLGGGFRPVKRAVQIGKRVTLNGFAHEINRAPKALLVGGYAITPGVDSDFIKEWLAQNADADLVRNNLIFAIEKPGETEAKAKAHASTMSGLEPATEAKMPKGVKKA